MKTIGSYVKAVSMMLFLSPVITFAQNPENSANTEPRHRQSYAFVAPGTFEELGRGAVTTVGIGTEWLYRNGMGFGADGAVFKKDSDAGVLLSMNGAYHFLKLDKKGRMVPFATGGASLVAAGSGYGEGGALGGVNVGGGFSYWIKRSYGIRAEFRDHEFLSEGYGSRRPEFRIGITF